MKRNFIFLCSFFCTQRNSGRDGETHEQQLDDNSPNNRRSTKICFLSSRCWWTSVTVLLLSANKHRGSEQRSAPNLRDERPNDEPLGFVSEAGPKQTACISAPHRLTSGGETHGNVQVWKCRLLFFFSSSNPVLSDVGRLGFNWTCSAVCIACCCRYKKLRFTVFCWCSRNTNIVKTFKEKW